ncbi:MAG: restriction endonuclease subunit S [Ancrocorticia sp.]
MSIKAEIGTVSSVPFSELLCNVVDNRGRTCPTAASGLPLIATNCVKNEHMYPTYDTVRYVDDETYKNWFRGHPVPGDLLFVTKGSPGRVCMVPDPVDFCIAQDMVAIRADNTKIYPRFLFALLRSQQVQEQIEQLHVGTMIPHFKKGDFDKLHLQLPDRVTQEFVGDIYFNLSAKIELNRRRNRTLEAMARAIFQSWFVDFDPVKAKAAGRTPPGLSPALAALFPDRFEDSALGPIPAGWETRPLYEVARFVNGAAFRTEDFCDPADGLPVVKIAELKDGLTAQTKYSKRNVSEDQRIDTGDLLYSWSGSPDTSLDAFLWSLGPGLLNQHIFKVISPNAAHQRFIFYLLKSLRSVLVETARNKQTTGLGHVTVADMKRLQVCWASTLVMAAFDQLVSALYDKAFVGILESQTLAALRDSLLPKLISGELRVPDAERIVARTT